jgi:hypothetical protein
MTRYFLSLVFFLFSGTIFCQLRTEFNDYDRILTDLHRKGQKSEYYKNLDFESMLYLDKRCLKEFLKLDPKFLIKYNLDTTQFSLPGINQYTSYFETSIKDIRQFFIDPKGKEHLRRYLLDQDHDEFNPVYPIYIKDSARAVFSNGNKTYRITLEKGQLKTEILSVTIE